MASLEEEKLVQMVNDFIESEPEPEPPSLPISSINHSSTFILQGILGSYTKEEMEVMEKAKEFVREMRDDGKMIQRSDIMKRRLMMSLRKQGFDASLCMSSSLAYYHEYIDIVKNLTCRIIIDIEFKSQFELARPTMSYAQLSSSLPNIFVGSEEKLKKVVAILSSAIQQCLRESGLHVPPWRKSCYMKSKWFSCNCNKVSNPSIIIPYHDSHMIRDKKKKKKKKKGSHASGGLSSQFS